MGRRLAQMEMVWACLRALGRLARTQIFHFPELYRSLNPSQHFLYENLPHGFDVSYGTAHAALWLKKRKPNKKVVLHIHWLTPMLEDKEKYLAGLTALKAAGGKIVWTVHNLFEHDTQDKQAEAAFRAALAQLADVVHVHHEADKALIASAYYIPPEKYVVAPHGHYIGLYPNDMAPSKARRDLRILPDQTVFLFFGMVRPYKGIEELVAAFEAMAHPRALLLVVGKVFNWPQGHALMQREHARIRMIEGFVPDERVQDYMNAADFCVLPYRDVLTSGSAMLALGFGKPVIAPHALASVIEHGVDGLLYGPGGLADALAHAASLDADARLAMSVAAMSKAENHPWSESARLLAEAMA